MVKVPFLVGSGRRGALVFSDWYHLYEEFFPARSAQITFLASRLPLSCHTSESTTVLDVACGTGAYSRALAMLGVRVTSIDIDLKMLDHASHIAAAEFGSGGPGAGFAPPTFVLADMADLVAATQRRKFHLVFCIGNSLTLGSKTEAPDRTTLEKRVGAMSQSVMPDGRLVLQTVNFDRILPRLREQGEIRMPILHSVSRDASLERFYRWRGNGTVEFLTSVRVAGIPLDDRPRSTLLTPVKAEELSRLVSATGLTVDAMSGDFAGEPLWTPASPATILTATMPRVGSGNHASH